MYINQSTLYSDSEEDHAKVACNSFSSFLNNDINRQELIDQVRSKNTQDQQELSLSIWASKHRHSILVVNPEQPPSADKTNK